MPKLIFIDKDFSGQVYELVLEKTTVGRGDQNTLVIHDNSLSAAHCEIMVNGSEVIVRDLDSRNGTFVNGIRLKNQPAQLKYGQTVRLGAVEARLELDSVYVDEPGSEITAFHAHCRYVSALKQLQAQRKPASASTHLKSKAHPVAEEHTVLLPKEVLTGPAPAPPAPPDIAPDAETRSRARLILIAAVIVLCLIVLCWLLWKS